MPYTFWYSGILIGDSDLDDDTLDSRRRAGALRLTEYGREIFPRLTGILTAGHALESFLNENGLSADDMDKEEIQEVFDTTAAGQKIADIGRALSDVEMRAPDGTRLSFASIAFIDLLEFQQLTRELGDEPADEPTDLPPGAARYIVSATLGEPDDEPRAPAPPVSPVSLN